MNKDQIHPQPTDQKMTTETQCCKFGNQAQNLSKICSVQAKMLTNCNKTLTNKEIKIGRTIKQLRRTQQSAEFVDNRNKTLRKKTMKIGITMNQLRRTQQQKTNLIQATATTVETRIKRLKRTILLLSKPSPINNARRVFSSKQFLKIVKANLLRGQQTTTTFFV